jgi:hypothetical protein
MKEHVEHLLQIAKRKKSKQILDENGDIDFPVIRTVSILHVLPYFFIYIFLKAILDIFLIKMNSTFINKKGQIYI